MSDVMAETLQGKRRHPHKGADLPTALRDRDHSGSMSDDGVEERSSREPSSVGSSALPINSGKLAVMVLLAAVAMMFAAFTSTFVVREGSIDWAKIPIPSILWGTTAVLLLSSGVIAWSKRALRENRLAAAQRGVLATLVSGLLFVGGQWLAWQELVTVGVIMQQSAHAAFFYILTALHVLHVAGGLVALIITLLRNRLERDAPSAYRRLDNTALYWHFVDGLWVYLFVLLFFV